MTVTLFLRPLFNGTSRSRQQPLRLLSACPPAALSVRRWRVCAGETRAFHGPENKHLCLATASSSCLFKYRFFCFFCSNPGSVDATWRSLMTPPPLAPSPLPSVSVRLSASNAQALALTGGGQRRSIISGREDSACISAPVLTEVRGTWTTARRLIHATLSSSSSQGRSTRTSVAFHQTFFFFAKKIIQNNTNFLGPFFLFFKSNAQRDFPMSLWVKKIIKYGRQNEDKSSIL